MEEYNFTVRLINSLKSIGITNIDDLRNYSFIELKQTGLGSKSATELLDYFKNSNKTECETYEKKIKDKINALKSKLAEEKTEKISKKLNQELIKELEIKIQTLKEIL